MKNGPLLIGETAKNAPGVCTTVSTCAKMSVTQQAHYAFVHQNDIR